MTIMGIGRCFHLTNMNCFWPLCQSRFSAVCIPDYRHAPDHELLPFPLLGPIISFGGGHFEGLGMRAPMLNNCLTQAAPSMVFWPDQETLPGRCFFEIFPSFSNFEKGRGRLKRG
jgi:hypothetical protein